MNDMIINNYVVFIDISGCFDNMYDIDSSTKTTAKIDTLSNDNNDSTTARWYSYVAAVRTHVLVRTMPVCMSLMAWKSSRSAQLTRHLSTRSLGRAPLSRLTPARWPLKCCVIRLSAPAAT